MSHFEGYDVVRYKTMQANGSTAEEIAQQIRTDGEKLEGASDLVFSKTYVLLSHILNFDSKTAKAAVLKIFNNTTIEEHESSFVNEIENGLDL